MGNRTTQDAPAIKKPEIVHLAIEQKLVPYEIELELLKHAPYISRCDSATYMHGVLCITSAAHIIPILVVQGSSRGTYKGWHSYNAQINLRQNTAVLSYYVINSDHLFESPIRDARILLESGVASTRFNTTVRLIWSRQVNGELIRKIAR